MSTILITGSASGLGRELWNQLVAAGHKIVHYDHQWNEDVRHPAVDHIKNLDVLINCAGVNRIGPVADFTEDLWDRVMDTNAKGIYMMYRALLPLLIASKGTVVNIISNASHMPMTDSLAYNASKGAAHIMTLQMARESWKRGYGITVFGISPNKMAGTQMSNEIDQQVMANRGWTAEEAAAYQKTSLLSGEETPPSAVAEFITFLLQDKAHHKYLTGCILPYGA